MNPDELRVPAQRDEAEAGKPAPPAERAHPGVFIGKVRGIRFYLDYSWFLIAAVLVYLLSGSTFPYFLHGRTPGVYLCMGVAATVFFFLSILLHELGHSVISQRCGIPVPSITLLFIGGIAEISREPDDARSELKIAVAGPAVSMILVALYLGLGWLCKLARMPEAEVVFGWLAGINLWLVIFNAIPGYPLDGGRVLRAILWMRSGKLRRATYITSRIGVGLSWVLMALGVMAIWFQGAIWNALIFILIGIFIKNAAESGYTQTIFKEVLNGIRVHNLMTRDPITVPARLPLSLAVDEYFLTNHHVAFPVVDDDGRYRGLLRLEYLKSVPREKWPYTTAGEIADLHGSRSLSVTEDALASNAFRTLLTGGQGRLGVLDNEDRLVGIITRHDLLHFIRVHTELEGA